MVYYRKYVISYLAQPNVSSLSPNYGVDYDAFVSRYFDISSMRLGTQHIHNMLLDTLKGMVEDGILEEIVIQVRTGKSSYHNHRSYKIKDKDHVMLSETFNQTRYSYYTIMSKA